VPANWGVWCPLSYAGTHEWALTDFAIWTAGAVSVPIYETSSALQVGFITLDAEMLPFWARNQKLGNLSTEDARTNDIVHAELERAVKSANEAVSKPESIRRFAVLPGDLTEENLYLTPSLKLRRNIVMKAYAAEVEALYSDPRK
jgi:long-subunit acyl-CoA synthetase (AMP-forming)